jgi:hypothetical protein
MIRFYPCSIIILGQILQTSTRSTLAAGTTSLFHNRALYHRNVALGSNSQQSSYMSKPDLISWTQSHLGALYEAREDEAFANAFDTAFSPSCEVRVNHAPSTLEALRDSVSSRTAAGTRGVALSWENVISTDDNPDEVSFHARPHGTRIHLLLIALGGCRNFDHHS